MSGSGSGSNPKAWNISTALLIAANSEDWELLFEEHMAVYRKLKPASYEIEIEHARLDRIRLERMLQALRFMLMVKH